MTSWSNGSEPRPHGAGQCGMRRPVSTRAARWASPSVAATCVHQGSEGGPAVLGFGRELGAQPAAGAVEGHGGHAVLERPRVDQQEAGGHGPLQIEMGIVLPGEADAPQDLHALLGTVRRRLEAQRTGDPGTQRPFVGPLGTAPGRRGVPGHGRRLLDTHQHVGQRVLDGLELPDGPAELHPHLGVLRRRVQAPTGHAGPLRRRQDQGRVPHVVGRRARAAGSPRSGRCPGPPRARPVGWRRARGGSRSTGPDPGAAGTSRPRRSEPGSRRRWAPPAPVASCR